MRPEAGRNVFGTPRLDTGLERLEWLAATGASAKRPPRASDSARRRYAAGSSLREGPGLETALDELGAAPTLVDDVRTVIRRCMDGERHTVERVAEEMGMSSRTLQRRLAAAGASYQALLDEVRRQSARRLLANHGSRHRDVAFLLDLKT